MTRTSAHLLRIFVTGLLAALPLAATVAVFWWAASLLIRWLGPDSVVGGALGAIGLSVTESEIAGYLIGIALVALAIFVLGLWVETGVQRGLHRLLDSVVARIPLVGTVYDLTRRMVGLMSQREGSGMQSMSAVWCHFGGPSAGDGPGGVVVLGLLSTPEPVMIDGRPYMGVIVPTAPVPVGGGLLYLPQDWVKPAAVGFEAVTSIYVSMGLTSAQHLPGRTPPPA